MTNNQVSEASIVNTPTNSAHSSHGGSGVPGLRPAEHHGTPHSGRPGLQVNRTRTPQGRTFDNLWSLPATGAQQTPLVRISGAPGTGKTWLCHRLAQEHLDTHGPNGRVVLAGDAYPSNSAFSHQLTEDPRCTVTQAAGVVAAVAAATISTSAAAADHASLMLIIDDPQGKARQRGLDAVHAVVAMWPQARIVLTSHQYTRHLSEGAMPADVGVTADFLLNPTLAASHDPRGFQAVGGGLDLATVGAIGRSDTAELDDRQCLLRVQGTTRILQLP